MKESQTGDDYSKIPEVIVVYISEFDFLKEGKTIYHIDKVIRETGSVIDDGLHEVLVNTVVDDGSDIADLMSCFTKRMVDNPKFPIFSNEMKYLKESEGGAGSVCQVMQKYEEAARQQGMQQGIQQGMQQGMQQEKYNNARAMLREGLSLDMVSRCIGLPVAELKELNVPRQ